MSNLILFCGCTNNLWWNIASTHENTQYKESDVQISLSKENPQVSYLWALTTLEIENNLWFFQKFPRIEKDETINCMFSSWFDRYSFSAYNLHIIFGWWNVKNPEKMIFKSLVETGKININSLDTIYQNYIQIFTMQTWENFESQIKNIYLADEKKCIDIYEPLYFNEKQEAISKFNNKFYYQGIIDPNDGTRKIFTWKVFSWYSNFWKNINALFENNEAKAFIVWEKTPSGCKTNNDVKTILLWLWKKDNQYYKLVWNFASDGFACPNQSIDIER